MLKKEVSSSGAGPWRLHWIPRPLLPLSAYQSPWGKGSSFVLPYTSHILPSWLPASPQTQQQQSQVTMDWNLWNLDPTKSFLCVNWFFSGCLFVCLPQQQKTDQRWSITSLFLDPISLFISTLSFQLPGEHFYLDSPTHLEALASSKIFYFPLVSPECFHHVLSLPSQKPKSLQSWSFPSQAQSIFKSNIFSLLQTALLFCSLLLLLKFYFSKIFPTLFENSPSHLSDLLNPFGFSVLTLE